MLQIVFTGGPSSGKTSVINSTVEHFRELGYHVIVVSEASTELINSGIKPFGDDSLKAYDYQKIVFELQLTKERIAKLAAESMNKDKTIILYDRGLLDGYAYIDHEEWEELLLELGLSKINMLSNYDAVIYLENASQFFTTANNKARYENDASEASRKGDLVLQSYLSHDNLIVVHPKDKLVDKQQEVIGIVQNLLGQPIPIRNQRRFLVEDININALGIITNAVDITQDYLGLENGYEYRIRKISQDNNETYHFNIQKKLTNGLREVIRERTIEQSEYETLLLSKDDDFTTIRKRRYSFVYGGQYFKLDVFDNGLVMLEANVTKDNPELVLPDFIKIAREVTDEPDYSNINIARGKETTYGKRKVNSY